MFLQSFRLGDIFLVGRLGSTILVVLGGIKEASGLCPVEKGKATSFHI